MNKYIWGVVLFGLSGMSVAKTIESNLKVQEVGAWAQGNSILYVSFDREVGPSSCRNKTVKVYLGEDASSESSLKAMSTIRSMALVALTSGLNVKIVIPDECLHNAPSIESMYLSK